MFNIFDLALFVEEADQLAFSIGYLNRDLGIILKKFGFNHAHKFVKRDLFFIKYQLFNGIQAVAGVGCAADMRG